MTKQLITTEEVIEALEDAELQAAIIRGLRADIRQVITDAVEDKDARIRELQASLQAASFQLTSVIARERRAVQEERERCASEARWVAEEHLGGTVGQSVALEIERKIRARSTASGETK